MNKIIIFDLDGVLIDSKEIHFNSLNLALRDVDPKYIITRAEQDILYEGLPTKTKLDILNKTKGLPEKYYDEIWKNKQKYSSWMFLSVNVDSELVSMFKVIRSAGINIAVASNSIRNTLDICLKGLGVYDLIDYTLSNEDVKDPKPSSEIYDKCIKHFKTTPDRVVIFEDSVVGKQAARGSGAELFEVENRSDLTIDKINDSIDYLNGLDYEE